MVEFRSAKRRGKAKKTAGKGIAQKDKLIKNDSFMLFKLINHGYKLFSIVKGFTFKLLWTGSCFAFMFMLPVLFEIFSEQEEVMEKIAMDDLIAQATDLGGGMGGGAPSGGPMIRPF